LDYNAWSNIWRRSRTGLRTHDLRHFTASALIAGGASVKLVQTVLGHSSAVVTLKTYAHLWPGGDERTRGVIEALAVLRTPGGLTDQEKDVVAGQDG
jgi:integrase